MTVNRLRADLADLAADVDRAGPRDLADDVRRTARRLRRRQVLGSGAAVVALLVVAGLTTSALLGPGPIDPPVGTPTPRPTSAAAPAALFYVDSRTGVVTRVTPSGVVSSSAAHVGVDGAGTLTVSPDRRRMAVVEADGATLPATRQYLTVYGSPDAREATLYNAQPAAPCAEPSWSGDGSTILVAVTDPDTGATRLALADVHDPRAAPFPGTLLPGDVTGCHFIWSADTAVIAYSRGDGRITIRDRANGATHDVPGLGPAGPGSFDPISLSPDGRRLVVDRVEVTGTDPDPARSTGGNTVVDTVTGQVLALPVTGTVVAAYYQVDGLLVVRSEDGGRRQVSWISPAGQVVLRRDEPAGLAGLDLVP